VEVKCTDHITLGHKAQMINYLKATGLNVGLIINFGKSKVEYERIVVTRINADSAVGPGNNKRPTVEG